MEDWMQSGSDYLMSHLGPYDFRDEENADGTAEEFTE